MKYSETARDIFNWLKKLQVKQKEITAELVDYQLFFLLEHPLEGKIKVEIPYPESEYFTVKGIGLQIKKKERKIVIISVYDYGGIFDPIDYYNPGDHYAATHFALLGALLYEQCKDPDLIIYIKRAVDFHLRTSKDEYRFEHWGYHWDFKNYAFLETYGIMKKYLSEEEMREWKEGLYNYRENKGNNLTNWMMMRAYSALLRYNIFHNIFQLFRFLGRMLLVRRAMLPDGCFDDFPHTSRPIQYHVFVLALLHRIYLLKPSSIIRNWFLKGVKYYIHFIDPDGCFNYLGRGQEQIFGYGIGLYVLEAAKSLDNKQATTYQDFADRMWKYLYQYKRNKIFPLVLNNRNDSDQCGWYDYHHLTVYEAFLGVWLAFAQKNIRANEIEIKKSVVKTREIKHFRSSGNIVYSNEYYFTVFSRGTLEYLSEPGITPVHLWFKKIGWFFSCPGGPYAKFGKNKVAKNIDKNFFAPIAKSRVQKQWYVPAFNKSEYFHLKENKLIMVYNYGPFTVKRVVIFQSTHLLFRDEFSFNTNEEYEYFRFFNLPIISDKFDISVDNERNISCRTDEGVIGISLQGTNLESLIFRKSDIIKTAKGVAEVITLENKDFRTDRGEIKYISFNLNFILDE